MAWLLLCPPSNVRFFFPVNVSSAFSWEFLMVPHRSSPTGLPRMCDICHVLLPQFGLVVICSLWAGGGHFCLCPCHITTIEPVSWPRVFPLRSPKWTRGTVCITLTWYKYRPQCVHPLSFYASKYAACSTGSHQRFDAEEIVYTHGEK